MSVSLYVYSCICLSVYSCICLSVCMSVCLFICLCEHVYVHNYYYYYYYIIFCLFCILSDIVTCMALDKAGTGEHLVTGSRDTTCVVWKFKQDVCMYMYVCTYVCTYYNIHIIHYYTHNYIYMLYSQ